MTASRYPVTQYDMIAKGIHWKTAFFVLCEYVLVVMMKADALPPTWRETSLAWHKSLGILIILLTLIRILWRFAGRMPTPCPALSPREKIVTRIVNVIFYILLLALPLSGWVMTGLRGHDVNLFGLWVLPTPALLGPDSPFAFLGPSLHESHEVLANAMLVLIVLHVGAALKHHFGLRDEVLLRITPRILVKFLHQLRGGTKKK